MTEQAHKGQEKSAQLFKSYVIGLLLSLIFVTMAYLLVQEQVIASTQHLFIALAILLVLQVGVQIIFYLRLDAHKGQDHWALIAFIFTLIVMMIVVGGSLWIMYNLYTHMVL